MRAGNSSKVPTRFCTTARKVEPMGADCVRIYLAVEKNGEWEDRLIVEMPIKSVLQNSRFVVDATMEIARTADEAETDQTQERMALVN